jgi:hypothetical protein
MSVAYVSSKQQIFQFGGDDARNTPLAETWVLGNQCWAKVTPGASPTPRDTATVAYDAARDIVVLYGGRGGAPGLPAQFLYDTWVWDSKAWHLASVIGPRLIAPAAAYDPNAREVIMFGSTAGGIAETWAWDGLTWRQLHPAASPDARLAASLTLDVTSNHLLLFGGDQTLQPVSETWAWDGSNWQNINPPASPSARFGAAMASYESGRLVVLNGGLSRSELKNDTWVWDGRTWTEQHPSHVPTSPGGTIAVDTGQALELIGSQGAVWSWSGTDWVAA